MAIPWIIGGLAVAAIAAIASSDDDSESEQDERDRINRAAKIKREKARRDAEDKAVKDNKNLKKKYAKYCADEFVLKFDLPGLIAADLAIKLVENSESAKLDVMHAYSSSEGSVGRKDYLESLNNKKELVENALDYLVEFG